MFEDIFIFITEHRSPTLFVVDLKIEVYINKYWNLIFVLIATVSVKSIKRNFNGKTAVETISGL